MTAQRRSATLIMLGVLLLSGCSSTRVSAPTISPTSRAPSASPTSPSPASSVAPIASAPPTGPTGVARFEPTDCPFDAAQTPGYAVDCGFVVVPQLHRNPTGPTIRLAVARFRSQASAPAPDPVIFLTGGPGGPGLISTSTANIAYNFTPTRDFIAFDQRGVG
jgi:hypothetical protein